PPGSHRTRHIAPVDDRVTSVPAPRGTHPSAGDRRAMVQASARSREAHMEETTTARETTPATDGTASFGLSSGTAVIGAANPDGAPVVPSLLPGTAQQMLAEVETGVITYV